MQDKSPLHRERLLIALILVLAMFHGLIYIFLLPPWQHYDEQNHFEYAWLAARLNREPTIQDTSPKLNRQVLKSMIANGFFDKMAIPEPLVGPPSEKIDMPGYSQLSEPPLYYLIAGLPLRLLGSKGIDLQLYFVRLVNLFFLVLTVLAAWAVAKELFPPGNPIRWMLPLALALNPGFVDLMTAVNNDSMAIAVSALLLWMMTRLIRRGFSWLDFIFFTYLAFTAWFTKITALFALVGFLPVLLFSLLRGRKKWIAWLAFILLYSSILAVSVRWDDALAWYRYTPQNSSLRMKTVRAPLGEFAIRVEGGMTKSRPWYPEAFQHLSASTVKELAGKPVTFGYWIWSDQDIRARSPVLRFSDNTYSEMISVSKEPVFYAFQAVVPASGGRIWVELSPKLEKPGQYIYLDGLVLVEGQKPISKKPVFNSPDGHAGTWGEEPFENFLRNPSAEMRGPRLNPIVDDLIAHRLPDNIRPSLLLASLVDGKGTIDLYPVTLRHLFQTFWARFGWGNIPPLQADRVYRFLAYFSVFGAFGALLAAIRRCRKLPWDMIAIYSLITLSTVLMALTRGGGNLIDPLYYYPTARYIYPAVIPILLLLLGGWLEIFGLLRAGWNGLLLPRRSAIEGSLITQTDTPPIIFFLFFIVFFLTLDLLSIIGIARYFGM